MTESIKSELELVGRCRVLHMQHLSVSVVLILCLSLKQTALICWVPCEHLFSSTYKHSTEPFVSKVNFYMFQRADVLPYCYRLWMTLNEAAVDLVQLESSEQRQSCGLFRLKVHVLMVVQYKLQRYVFKWTVFVIKPAVLYMTVALYRNSFVSTEQCSNINKKAVKQADRKFHTFISVTHVCGLPVNDQ